MSENMETGRDNTDLHMLSGMYTILGLCIGRAVCDYIRICWFYVSYLWGRTQGWWVFDILICLIPAFTVLAICTHGIPILTLWLYL